MASDPHNTPGEERPSGRFEIPPHIFYPALVVGILLMAVIAQLTILVLADSDGGPQVVPHYYEKSLRWDKKQAAAAAKRDGVEFKDGELERINGVVK